MNIKINYQFFHFQSAVHHHHLHTQPQQLFYMVYLIAVVGVLHYSLSQELWSRTYKRNRGEQTPSTVTDQQKQ